MPSSVGSTRQMGFRWLILSTKKSQSGVRYAERAIEQMDRPARRDGDRRKESRDRWQQIRRLSDMTIPPSRINCCPQGLEVIEHHLGNALGQIGGLLERLRKNSDVLTATEQEYLRGAQAQLRRLQSVRSALSSCGHAVNCKEMGRRFGWRERIASWILG